MPVMGPMGLCTMVQCFIAAFLSLSIYRISIIKFIVIFAVDETGNLNPARYVVSSITERVRIPFQNVPRQTTPPLLL